MITLSDIEEARARFEGHVSETPLVWSQSFSRLTGRDVYLKAECMQRAGSFKIRGAWNAIRKLTPDHMRDGVWTVSAGNAAQGVALAAKLAGVPCSVMVIETAPETKLRSVASLGAPPRVVRAGGGSVGQKPEVTRPGRAGAEQQISCTTSAD